MLPEIVVQLTADDTATVITDAGARVVSRDRLGASLAALAEDASCPVRIEFHDADDARHVDILAPPTASDPNASSSPDDRHGVGLPPSEIDRGGFLPGETVLVAPATRTVTADASGRLSVRLDRRTRRTAVGGLLLFGTVSGSLLLVEAS